MADTQARLDRAKCIRHFAYDPDCLYCTRRYYQQLIDGDYVARHEHEATLRSLRAAEATLRSLRRRR